MREQWFIMILNKYKITTLNSIVYTCRLHVDDIFDERYVMASTGLVMVLFILFICIIVFLYFH